jgi:hypothetical protein
MHFLLSRQPNLAFSPCSPLFCIFQEANVARNLSLAPPDRRGRATFDWRLHPLTELWPTSGSVASHSSIARVVASLSGSAATTCQWSLPVCASTCWISSLQPLPHWLHHSS